jgi:hypothetical protein
MLLNEFLKEHRKVEQLEKQVEKLTAGLQKVSAQIELNKSAPQTVLNSVAPQLLNTSYAITADIDVPQGGGDGSIVPKS